MADVLMVNINNRNIGNHKAGNMDLLRAIMEVNFRLFADGDKKRILFVIRDIGEYNPGNQASQIKKNLDGVWN